MTAPDGAEVVVVVGDDLIGVATNYDFDTFQTVVVAPVGKAIDIDADDLGAVSQIDLADLALTAAHGGGIEGVALADVLGHQTGEPLVDFTELHIVFLLRHSAVHEEPSVLGGCCR